MFNFFLTSLQKYNNKFLNVIPFYVKYEKKLRPEMNCEKIIEFFICFEDLNGFETNFS
jgi:hypothetical protein